MKMLLFGGTFNPPHNGHIALLHNCIAEIHPDEVRVIPAGVPPHKTGVDIETEHRLAMCEVFTQLFTNCVIDDREINRTGKSYTIDTIHELRADYKAATFYLCIGSDMFLSFEEWHCYQDILREVVLTVHVRTDTDKEKMYDMKKALEEQGANIILLTTNYIDVSSSEIRKLCAENKDIHNLVPPFVYEYIQKHHLYKKKPTTQTEENATLEALLKETLSNERAHHVLNVRDMAVKLAGIYHVDAAKAETAALLHDLCKENSDEENLRLIKQDAIIFAAYKNLLHAIIHGPAAAAYAKYQLHIIDQDILNAVTYHTTGRENMSMLEKVVFLADKISNERDYPGVERIRVLALQGDIDDAMILFMEDNMDYLQTKGKLVDETTYAALQYLLKEKTEDR